MHIYGNGRHPDPLPRRHDRGLTDRNGSRSARGSTASSTGSAISGFLQKPGVETKAAKDVAAYADEAPHPGEA